MPEHLYFFGGADPAPSETQRSDHSAFIVGAAQPRILPERGQPLPSRESDWFFDLVYARRFTAKEKASARQQSGFIHHLDEMFGFEKFVVDAGSGGGGVYIQRELLHPRQIINGVEREVTPIGDQKEAPFRISHGKFILHMFRRGDPGIELLWPGLAGDDQINDALYCAFKDALDHGLIGLPGLYSEWMQDRREQLKTWPEERVWALKNLTALVEQCKNIIVGANEDGTFAFTARGARRFSAQGKKDFVSAAMFCYLGFLIWLRAGSFATGISPENEIAFGGF